jgi:centrosomal protein CEP104
VQFAVEQCVPVLVDKIGDNNARVRDGARDALLTMAGMKESGMRAMSSTFVKPVRNQTAWRPVLGTLTLLQELVPKLGISGRPGEGFELGELMDYVGKAFNSPNADVRSAAVKVRRPASVVAGLEGWRMLHMGTAAFCVR